MARVVLLVIGCLLLTTAILKVSAVLTDPFVDLSLSLPKSVIILGISIELALVLLIFSSIPIYTKCLLALSSLLAFGSISFARTILGYSTCGCFGQLAVPPSASFVISFALCMLLLPSTLRLRKQAPVALGLRGISCSVNSSSISPVAYAILALGALYSFYQVPPIKSFCDSFIGNRPVVCEAVMMEPQGDPYKFTGIVHLKNSTDMNIQIAGYKTSCGCVVINKSQLMKELRSLDGVDVRVDVVTSKAKHTRQKIDFYLNTPKGMFLCPVTLLFPFL